MHQLHTVPFRLTAAAVWAVCFSIVALAGCTDDKSDLADAASSAGATSEASHTGGDAVNQPTAIDGTLFQNGAVPAAEECCTQVGKMDECWWEDAIADGITCTKDGDCEYNVVGACVKDPTSGSSLGVCKCRDGVPSDCNDVAGKRKGVCIEDSAAGYSVCGPSYCNGYLKCSCFGGCEWWDQEDLTNTPQKVADAESIISSQNILCCEGTYPLGGKNVKSYYGVNSCNAADFVECVNNSDCDDANACTDNICNASGACEYPALADNTVCAVDANPLDCVVPRCSSGTCINAPLDGVACGSDTDATDCINGSVCAAGVCNPVWRADGSACGSDTDTDPTDCISSIACASGVCTVNQFAAGTSCGSGVDTDTSNCLEGYVCDASANCIPSNSTAGSTPCDIDTNTYPENCFDGYCGAVATYTPTLTFDTANPGTGNCMPVEFTAATNDTCSSVQALGAFSGGTAKTVTVTGSTQCAADNFTAAGSDCYEGTGSTTLLGAGSNDVVYSFTYTPTAAQTSLYGFLVTVEADFNATVYATKGGTCAAPASHNPCMRHPGPVTGTSGLRYEYDAQDLGANWSGDSQMCGAGDYEWCTRGTWTYSPSPTAYQFTTAGTITPAATVHRAQTVIFPTNNGTTTAQTFHVIVDGSGGDTTGGNFTLKVEGRLWNNGQCERVFDDPRVYDATAYGTYKGNITSYANSTHSATGTCGGYACGANWGGVTTAHTAAAASQYWPAQAFFKLQPTANTGYCIRTTAPASNALANPIVEVRTVSNKYDLCSTEYAAIDADLGSAGIELNAVAGATYLIAVSGGTSAAAPCSGNCNYTLVVENITTGACAPAPVGGCTLASAISLGSPGTLTSWLPDNSCFKIGAHPSPGSWSGMIAMSRNTGPNSTLPFTWTNGTVTNQAEAILNYQSAVGFTVNNKSAEVLISMGGTGGTNYQFQYFYW